MPPNQRANKYDHTPRKVFDKALDRIELKRLRDKEDHRADLQLVLQKLVLLRQQLDLLAEHVDSHCGTIGAKEGFTKASEGLE